MSEVASMDLPGGKGRGNDTLPGGKGREGDTLPGGKGREGDTLPGGKGHENDARPDGNGSENVIDTKTSYGAFLGIIRPGNCVMAALAVVIGCLIGMAGAFEGDSTQIGMADLFPAIILAPVVGALICAGGNVLNDVVDSSIDAISHPDRPIPRGLIHPETARRFSIGLFAVGALISLSLGTAAWVLALFNAMALIAYEFRLKATGISGNIMVAYLVSSTFLFGGAALVPVAGTDALIITGMFVFLAFLANLARELIKDIQDMEGDRGERTTLPMLIGVERTRLLAGSVILLAVSASFIPGFVYDAFSNWVYIGFIVLADAVLLYAMALAGRGSHVESTRFLKHGMLFALLGFLLGNAILVPL